MNDSCCGRRTGQRRWGSLLALLPTGLAGLMGVGCDRVLTIEKDDYINNAMHKDRPPDSHTGEPLEVAIVCVTPKDLKKDIQVNDALSAKAETPITADVWYANRPEVGDPDKWKRNEECGTRFRLPKDQIFLLTDESSSKAYFGKKVGGRLRGAKIDGKKTFTVRFPFDGDLHDDRSVIYVFPKFIGPGPDHKVLPVRPVKFDPPGAYTHKLVIKIGVDQGKFGDKNQNYGQYIERDKKQCPRKLHGAEPNDDE